MLTRIELSNFMSHTHTVIEPSPGLTVLVGPNNCGKSAVVIALQILAHNERSTYVLRHGEKEASISVQTDDGHTIEWRRPKSGSPSYSLDGARFDRLGSNVPEPVEKALRLGMVSPTAESRGEEFDLHFGQQKSPIFLIDEPSSVVAQFFASSSDAEKLVAMQQLHRDKVRVAKQDKGRLSTEREALEASIARLSPAARLVEQLEACQTLFSEITAAGDRHRGLTRSLTELTAALKTSSAALAVEHALSPLRSPPPLHDVPTMRRLITGISASSVAVAKGEGQAHALQSLQEPPQQGDTQALARLIGQLAGARSRATDAASLESRFEQLPAPPRMHDPAGLQAALKGLTEAQTAADAAAASAEDADKAMGATLKQINAWAAENQSCPTCGQALSEEQAVAIVTGEAVHHE